jgi:hypothetical protein
MLGAARCGVIPVRCRFAAASDAAGATGPGQGAAIAVPVPDPQRHNPGMNAMGTEDYMGSISQFAGSFAPRCYMDCDGATLDIARWTALFSILGTTYGGNGVNNFCLPDLRAKDAAGKPIPFGGGQMRSCICVEGIYPSRND